MEPTFRLATPTDIALLIDFMRQFYAIDQYSFDEHIARTALGQLLREHTLGRVWLITTENETIGYIVVTFGYSLEYHGRDSFIDELFVTEKYRNRGVGTKAMQFVLDQCPNLGIHALHLEVERSNVAGQALYQHVGFEDRNRHLMTKRIRN
jgi:diamine N-acetyltransferase